jgi:hypothetical protein
LPLKEQVTKNCKKKNEKILKEKNCRQKKKKKKFLMHPLFFKDFFLFDQSIKKLKRNGMETY